MALEEKISLSNLGLYRLEGFVGRQHSLDTLKKWLREYPVIAITGTSGVGKSTLATALAMQEAMRFEEGILWIGATGDELFHFYDIVRDIEDVLATGITNQPKDTWTLRMLQRLYGYHRLLIIDEFSHPDDDAIKNLVSAISSIGPGGHGTFILIGRTLPQPILDLVGEAHLHLTGMGLDDVAEWIAKHHEQYPLAPTDAEALHRITAGHPLLLKIVAHTWHTEWLDTLQQRLKTAAPIEDTPYDAIHITLETALEALRAKNPQALQLAVLASQASGGIAARALHQLYWRHIGAGDPLLDIAQLLVKSGVMAYNPLKNRYIIHPLVRQFLSKRYFSQLSISQQKQFNLAFTGYYVTQGHRYNTMPPQQWRFVDDDWGNVRKAFNMLVDGLEKSLDMTIEQGLIALESASFPDLPPQIDETLMLIRDYALSLRGYLQYRHPPEAMRWLSAGVIASRHLTDRRSEALLGLSLASVAYFLEDFSVSYHWYRRALPYFKEKRNILHVIEITKSLGVILRAMENLDDALIMYQQALQLAESAQDTANQSALATLIGSLWYHRQNYAEALQWYQRALALDEARSDTAWQGAQHNNIGLAVENLGNYEQAVEEYRKAEALHRAANNNAGLSTTFGNLGACYYALNQPHRALECYSRDLEIREQLGNWLDMAAILHNMGHVALELDDLSAVDDYFTRSRDLYLQFGQTDLAAEEQLLLDTIHDRRTKRG